MGLFQICLIAVAVCISTFPGAFASCSGRKCGCVYTDYSKIDKKDLICEQIHTYEFQQFLHGLNYALRYNWIAHHFVHSFTDHHPEITEVGKPLCVTEIKHILGFWKNHGSTLCLIVAPDIYKAECCGEQCCGANTKCEPSVFVGRKYLIYCDYYYGGSNTAPVAPAEASERDDFDPETLEFIAEEPGSGSGDGGTRPTRSTYYPYYGYGYFAFRDDPFPLTCSCRNWHC